MSNPSAGTSSKAKVGSSQPSEASFKRKRGVFQKDLQHMMYGFGDDANPFPETVTLVEDIVVEYITDMDTPKLNRCTELLSMQEELKQARKAFEVDEEKLATLE
ncbi:Transcription initiation factor TFIID subunit 13 [Hibiscus syriacus]|uniref:Transcription initiation factor TFIID subunit 13 n=1 Tax=Hibiscus syriacus TaxID=106335 RepID=A0A6A2ZD06_HIBSY|nr:Transcription initiation factor TFIID subunit 13 [Hibiscus syriacus]